MVESLVYFYRMLTVNNSMECRNCGIKDKQILQILSDMNEDISLLEEDNALMKTDNALMKTDNARLEKRVVELEEFKCKYDNMSHT
jgi:hypothetical protein